LKTPTVKAFVASLLLCISANKISAHHTEDTTRRTIMASVNKKPETIVVLKEANVAFPAILTGNESQSVDYVEKFFSARKNYLLHTYQRSKKLFPKVVKIFKKYNVPEEFKVLLALESGFNGNAVSSAGAVGYWQIMDEVAREYGLKITSDESTKSKHVNKVSDKKKFHKELVTDERKNFNKSTHAAARYLKDRSRNLNNDWLLIAASYNCGVGNVWNAMQKSGKRNPTFWDIKNFLPLETRTYVMNFIALNVLFNNYEKFSKNALCFKPITCKESSMETEDNCTSSL
jgi:soluble lytic murein transglycosylase-like protein